ncbi:MAG: hypothetical protein NVS2B16_14020 [Chloroflexota bacterium]
MFVLGLLLGPACALVILRVAGDLGGLKVSYANLILACALGVLLLIPGLALELRLGLVMGGFLGMLLASSPVALPGVEEN